MATRDRRSPSRRRFAVLITVGVLLWVFSGLFFETPLATAESPLSTMTAVLSALAAYGGAGVALLGLYRLLRAVEHHLAVDHDDQTPSPAAGETPYPS